MPNLKDIRRRIKSVKNTQKITQAMRMVAAAKVKRAENRVKAARPYAQELRNVFASVFHHVKGQVNSLEGSRYLNLLAPKEIKNVGFIVISSDRGLCGAYNSGIIRQTLKLETEALAQGFKPKFYLVGSKISQAYSRYGQCDTLGHMTGMTAAPSVHDATQIAETMTQAYLNGEIDQIEILSTHFHSMISYKVEMTPVIPLTGIVGRQLEADEAAVKETEPKRLSASWELEPDPVQVLDQLVPMYLSYQVYIHLLEAAASELAARMTAMTNATKNASEMIDRLTIDYNKARQAAITQELLEVVSGADAIS